MPEQENRLSEEEAREEAKKISQRVKKDRPGREEYTDASLFNTSNRLVDDLGLNINRTMDLIKIRGGIEKQYSQLKTFRDELQKAIGVIDKELSYFDQGGKPEK